MEIYLHTHMFMLIYTVYYKNHINCEVNLATSSNKADSLLRPYCGVMEYSPCNMFILFMNLSFYFLMRVVNRIPLLATSATIGMSHRIKLEISWTRRFHLLNINLHSEWQLSLSVLTKNYVLMEMSKYYLSNTTMSV